MEDIKLSQLTPEEYNYLFDEKDANYKLDKMLSNPDLPSDVRERLTRIKYNINGKDTNNASVDFMNRFLAKNFGGTIDEQIAGLSKAQPDLEFVKQGDKIVYRPKGSNADFKPLDPEGFDWQDITDVAAEIPLDMAGMALGEATVGAGLTAATGGAGTLPAMAAGAGTGLAASNALRQYLGSKLGYATTKDIGSNALQSGIAGSLTTLASPLATGLIRGAAKRLDIPKFGKDIAKKIYQSVLKKADAVNELAYNGEKNAVSDIALKYGITGSERNVAKKLLDIKKPLYDNFEKTLKEITPDKFPKNMKIDMRKIYRSALKELDNNPALANKEMADMVAKVKQTLFSLPVIDKTKKEFVKDIVNEIPKVGSVDKIINKYDIKLRGITVPKTIKELFNKNVDDLSRSEVGQLANFLADVKERNLGKKFSRFLLDKERKTLKKAEIKRMIEAGKEGLFDPIQALKERQSFRYTSKFNNDNISGLIKKTQNKIMHEMTNEIDKKLAQMAKKTGNLKKLNLARKYLKEYSAIANTENVLKSMWRRTPDAISEWDMRLAGLDPKAVAAKQILSAVSGSPLTTRVAQGIAAPSKMLSDSELYKKLSKGYSSAIDKTIPPMVEKVPTEGGLRTKRVYNKTAFPYIFGEVGQQLRRD